MILITYKLFFVLLLYKINAIFINSEDSYPKHVNINHLAHDNLDKKGFLKKLYNLTKTTEIKNDERPNASSHWNLEPTKKNSYSFQEYVQAKDNNFKFQPPMKYIEDDQLNIKNTINSNMFSSSFTQVNKACHLMKNDIAELFETQSSEIISSAFSYGDTTCEVDSNEFMETECTNKKSITDLTKSSSYLKSCAAIKDTSSPLFFKFTCGNKPKEAYMKTSTKPETPGNFKNNEISASPRVINMVRHVSQESMINLVVHVHCDKSEGKTHIIQQIPIFTSQNVYVTPNMMTPSPYLTYQSYTKTVSKQIISPYMYLNKYGQMPQTENTECKQNNFNQSTTESAKKAISKIKLGTMACEREENAASMEINSTVCQNTTPNYTFATKPQRKLPRPFLPQDVTLKCTTPSPVLKRTQSTTTGNTFKIPLFICQITNGLCKVPEVKDKTNGKPTIGSKTANCVQLKPRRQTTPKFKLWKHFSFPNIKFKEATTELCSERISLNRVTEKVREGITTVTCETETSLPITKLKITSKQEEGINPSVQEILGIKTLATMFSDLKTTLFSGKETLDHTKSVGEEEVDQESETLSTVEILC